MDSINQLNQSSDDSSDILIIDESYNDETTSEMDQVHYPNDQPILTSIMNELTPAEDIFIIVNSVVKDLVDQVTKLDINTPTTSIEEELEWGQDSDTTITKTDVNQQNQSVNDGNDSHVDVPIVINQIKDKLEEYRAKHSLALSIEVTFSLNLNKLTENEIKTWTHPVVELKADEPFVLKIKSNKSAKRKYQSTPDRPRYRCKWCSKKDDPYVGINSHVSRHVKTLHRDHVLFSTAFVQKGNNYICSNSSLFMMKVDKCLKTE